MSIDVKIVWLITRCLVHHVDAPQYSNATIGALPENFSYYSSSRRALFPGTDSSALNGSKKRPRVEKISSSRYRAYAGIDAGIDPGDVADVDTIATRSSFAAGSFFGEPRWMCIVLGVRNEQIHLHARTSPSFGRLKYFFEDCDLEAVVSQANRSSCAARCTQI